MKKIFAIILTATALFSLAPGLRAQNNTYVKTNKFVSGPVNGQYTLTLETYVTGKVQEQQSELPADIIVSMDISGSMKEAGGQDPTFTAVTKKVTTTGTRISETKNGKNSVYWTYSNTTGNSSGTADRQWFYKDGDNYYPVYKANNLGTNKNVRALWIVKSSKNYYIKPDGSGLTTTVPTSPTGNGSKLYTGTLYKGWSYATYKDADGNSQYTGADDKAKHYYSYGITANAAGTANSQFYYYDEGKVMATTAYYYPVHKVNNLSDGSGNNNVRALYIEKADGTGRQYLRINGLSTSYDKTIKTDYRTITMLPLHRAWTYNDVTAALNDGTTTGDAGGHWVKYSTDATGAAAYYPLQKEVRSDATAKYQVFFVDRNGTKRYLRPYGTSTAPVAYTAGTKVSLFFGTLYTVAGYANYTKYKGLERAISAFIEGLYKRSNTKGVHHRVAMTGWGATHWVGINNNATYHHPASVNPTAAQQTAMDNKTYPTSSYNKMASEREANYYYKGNTRKIGYPYMREVPIDADHTNANGVRVLKTFTDILSTDAQTKLKGVFTTTPVDWGDASDVWWAMAMCQALFQREGYANGSGKDFDGDGTTNAWEKSTSGLTAAAYKERPKIIINISDGGFNTTDWNCKWKWGKDAAHTVPGYTLTNQAQINYVNNNPGKSPHLQNSDLKAQAIADAKTIANNMKSNLGVKIYSIHVGTNGINANEKALASGTDYCLKAESYGNELLNAMLTIVEEIDGAGIDLGTEAVIQDIVTPEFSVPGGTGDIKLYTSKCIGEYTSGEHEGELKFETTKTAFTSGTVTKTVNSDGTTTLKVKGFNFKQNWCGLHAGGTYSGLKLIIEIPIIPDEDLVGGKVFTNTTDAKIVDGSGKTVGTYPRPQLKFPIHIQIAKQGLRDGDSAIFEIYKSKTAGGTTYPATPYMTVLLSGKSGVAQVTADITGLDADYTWKVVETGWSWNYDPEVTSMDTKTQTANPFLFKNTPKDDGPKNGEDVKQNKF